MYCQFHNISNFIALIKTLYIDKNTQNIKKYRIF